MNFCRSFLGQLALPVGGFAPCYIVLQGVVDAKCRSDCNHERPQDDSGEEDGVAASFANDGDEEDQKEEVSHARYCQQ